MALRSCGPRPTCCAFGEDKLTYEVPIVEVFVDRPPASPAETALIAPPWTTVPWPVLALSEEAVARGLAAFSRESARATRRARGSTSCATARSARVFARSSTSWPRDGTCRPRSSAGSRRQEAEARWAALRAFHEASGHFLVTNGPYRLASWTDDTSVLQVFRDLSYPRGLGVFNSHALPLRAFVTGTEIRAGTSSCVKAEVERVERFGREYQIVREPFVKRVVEQDRRSLPVGHYVVVGPDGAVAAAGTVEASEPGDYRVDLRAVDRPGRYVVLVALTVDDNRTDLPVKVVPWTR